MAEETPAIHNAVADMRHTVRMLRMQADQLEQAAVVLDKALPTHLQTMQDKHRRNYNG